MTRDEVKKLRETLQQALNGLSMGYKLTLGNCKFDQVATFKLEASPLKKDGTAETKESIDFKKLAGRYGLRPSDLGRNFTNHLGTFRLAGILPRSKKYPISATRQDGRKFKFPASAVKKLLDGPAKAGFRQEGGRILSLMHKNILRDWLLENTRKVELENPWFPTDWEDRLEEGLRCTVPCPFFNTDPFNGKKILDTSTLTFYLPAASDLPPVKFPRF